MTHAPGPWKFDRNGIGIPTIRAVNPRSGPSFDDIAKVAGLGNANEKEQLANAHLIAAAPDMLAALKCVIACLSQNRTYPADIAYAKKVARAAIVKAGTYR